jgi:large subunit ribosomal protein L31
MKEGIHPKYHTVQATCVCGNVIETGSTLGIIKLDICSACHPFFTGTQKIVDTEGRVERFQKKYANRAAAKK